MSIQPMSIQALCISEGGPVLDLSWEYVTSAVGIVVQLATNAEMTDQLQTYLLPPVGGVTLSCGGGAWYLRVGALLGDTYHGVIDFTGVYGPAIVVASPPSSPTSSSSTLVHTQALQGGVRLHLSKPEPVFALVDVSEDSRFPAAKTKTQYVYDRGHGFIDCTGLSFERTYSLRIHVTKGTPPFEEERKAMGLDTVYEFCKPLVTHGRRTARPVRGAGNGELSASRALAPVLREAGERPFVRFSSNKDYVRFLAAKARSGEELR